MERDKTQLWFIYKIALHNNKDAEECFFFFSLLFGDKYLEYAKVDFKPALQLLRSCLILKTKQHMGNTDLYPLDKWLGNPLSIISLDFHWNLNPVQACKLINAQISKMQE